MALRTNQSLQHINSSRSAQNGQSEVHCGWSPPALKL